MVEPTGSEGLLLALDGALGEPFAAIAPLRGGSASQRLASGVAPSGLMPQIAALLPNEARKAVLAVIVGVGPGSYSGIRAAAGAAASIALALGVPVVPVPSDAAIARAAGGVVYLALGAREVLRIEQGGSRLIERSTASDASPLDLAARNALRVGVAAALLDAGRAALTNGGGLDPAREAIELRYLAPPRGTPPAGGSA
jgi:tRNA threonylcarbamoyladenosine biosynthesis protein TsaB